MPERHLQVRKCQKLYLETDNKNISKRENWDVCKKGICKDDYRKDICQKELHQKDICQKVVFQK